jgi:hypothetical protein
MTRARLRPGSPCFVLQVGLGSGAAVPSFTGSCFVVCPTTVRRQVSQCTRQESGTASFEKCDFTPTHGMLARRARVVTLGCLVLTVLVGACSGRNLSAAESHDKGSSSRARATDDSFALGPELSGEPVAQTPGSPVRDPSQDGYWPPQHTPVDETLRRMLRQTTSPLGNASFCDRRSMASAVADSVIPPLLRADEPRRCMIPPDSSSAQGSLPREP